VSVEKDQDYIEHTMEAWKTTIEVQQHFNTLEMQIRNFAVTVLTAVLGAAAISMGQEKYASVSLGGFVVPLASILFLAGLVAWVSFYLMDRFWYHRLLDGAVEHAKGIENDLKDQLPGILLSTTIGKASALKLRGPDGVWEIHSNGKIDLFYGIVGLIVAGLLVASLFVRVD
jgi:hypothetical protein